MVNPLQTLEKILKLEATDHNYKDRAVSGGLARYADTWQKQAGDLYGAARRWWVEDIADRLRAYSSLLPESRQVAMRELLEMLHSVPQVAEPVVYTPVLPSATMPAKLLEPPPVAADAPAPPLDSVPAEPVRRVPEPDKSGRGLNAPVTTLTGVGKRYSQLLEKLGIRTVRDLLVFYPRRYEDYSQFRTIDHLKYGESVSVIVTVWEAGKRPLRDGKSLFHAIVSDHTGTMEVTWFNQPHLEKCIRAGMQLTLCGKVDQYLGRLTMNSPDWELVGQKELGGRIQAIYPLTETLKQRWMQKLIYRTLEVWATRFSESLPETLRRQYKLIDSTRALWGIHWPDNAEHLSAAQRRLAFEDVLYLQLGLLRQKLQWQAQRGQSVPVSSAELEELLGGLPYALTGAQRRSLEEMVRDMEREQPMNRLLQGDVGSGKTVVAALLLALTARAGFQAALMAPTEILAEQHHKSLARLFAAFPEGLRPTLGLLTGSVGAAEREPLYAGLADGSLQVVVGTHALIQETVQFKALALTVIDEQHRFGVEQRAALRQKGYNPHLLVMTATPIPRSLELTLWGHLDVSVLDEMPPGRQPISTRVLIPRERERAYTFIRHQVQQGRQAFVIYPLVEASDKIEARAAVDEHARLQAEVFPDLRLGLLHGRMRPDEKEAVMAQFAAHQLDVLVATSVVEVGIDVPNATVILIDGAERFGLAQLHQFRGRVGRGEFPSYCLLLAESASEDSAERLKVLESTTDGFVLAQKDLEMRGPGQFLGTQQSGFPELPLAALADTRLLHEARTAAAQVLESDPELAAPENAALARRVAEFWSQEGDLS